AGVEEGMRLSQAVALCPSLAILDPDPDFYEAVRESLLAELRAWSPIAEPAGPGRFFVGVDGLERLYGPTPWQVGSVLQRLAARFPAPLVDTIRIGVAPGTFGARVAAGEARPGDPIVVPEERLPGFLADRPVGVLPVSPRMIRRLERLGIHRLGRLVELPEPALVAQFGEDGRRALAWATARRIDPVVPRPRERPVRVALDFPAPVGEMERLHAALDRLLARALGHPERRGRSVREVRLSAALEGGGSWSTRAVLGDPTGRPDRIAFVLRSRVALAPPSRPLESLRLSLVRFGPPSDQLGLFEPRRDAKRRGGLDAPDGGLRPGLRDAARILERRLGGKALCRVLPLQPGSRLPERRHALLEIPT
ncbi:MAG: DNA polymerase Y family protein, partial [Gemmatimonadota bacterium]